MSSIPDIAQGMSFLFQHAGCVEYGPLFRGQEPELNDLKGSIVRHTQTFCVLPPAED